MTRKLIEFLELKKYFREVIYRSIADKSTQINILTKSIKYILKY